MLVLKCDTYQIKNHLEYLSSSSIVYIGYPWSFYTYFLVNVDKSCQSNECLKGEPIIQQLLIDVVAPIVVVG